VRWLAQRPRSTAEVESRLASFGFPVDVIRSTVARLSELGYLDESAVADAVVREGTRRSLGRRRIAQQLARRAVGDEVAKAALAAAAEGELERAQRLLARHFRGGFTSFAQRARAMRLLLARGYSHATVREAVGIDVDIDTIED
jgi:regulatory protein